MKLISVGDLIVVRRQPYPLEFGTRWHCIVINCLRNNSYEVLSFQGLVIVDIHCIEIGPCHRLS